MRKSSLFAASMLGLAGCTAGQPRADYPALVQKMVDADFPADGVIHVQSRGTFEIKPTTDFCTHRRGYGLSGELVRDALASIGQSDYLGGAPRANGIFGERATPGCDDKRTGNPIFVRGGETSNRIGKPYKLTLAIWQGNSAWVGVIERLDGLRADAEAKHVPVNDGIAIFGPTQDTLRIKARQENSRELDYNDLSKAFLAKLTGASQ